MSVGHVLVVAKAKVVCAEQGAQPCGKVALVAGNPPLDAGLARITTGTADNQVARLGVTMQAVARVTKDAQVIKSGTATGVTLGIVVDPDVAVPIQYDTGVKTVRGFLIKPDPSTSGPLIDHGDSGAPWLLTDGRGKALPLLAGVNVGFPAQGSGFPQDCALACHAEDVMKALGVTLWRPDALAPAPVPFIAAPAHAPPAPMLVATREAAILRGLPSQTANRLDGLAPGQLVHVLATRDGWAQVSLKGDNLIDGFVWADLLRPPG
ncbi:hypothetical protein [Sandarakinorhabdus oryzae]|uniref:hypothetical protein n=1 Tax=Sandarakinorhabdus oryzae TaxID=2675220 RepID=UPI0012E31405|nr:hypothetical protein [Sandarakinorhabdus oryzae]